jgi:Protein of unknown function, DUF481
MIVMNNGDRCTGEIKESKQLFVVRTEGGSVYSGTLQTAESPAGRPMNIQISESPAQAEMVERSQIVQVYQTSERFWERFNGQINSGITYSKGNQATQYNLSSSAEYPRERWTAEASINSSLTSSTGSSTSTRDSFAINALRLLRWNNWYYSGVANFLQSSEQSIQLQTNLGAGIGCFLKNTNHATISVLGGFAWQNTRYSADSQDIQNIAAAMVGADVKLFKFNKSNLSLSGTAFPALSQPGRVFLDTNVTYYVKLFSHLTWNVSFYGNWDNQPPAHTSGSDYGTSSGLGWSFGNK